MPNPNSFPSPEGEPLADRIERVDLLRELATRQEALAAEKAGLIVADSPELTAMLGLLVEGGPDLSTRTRQHLRKMIALQLRGLSEQQVKAMEDQRFFSFIGEELQVELAEMADFEEDLSAIPDQWDIALEDLTRMNGEDD